MANETILVMDDSAEMLSMLKTHMLEPVGYRVLGAMDVETGVKMAAQYNPDLILLGMNLTHMNGLAILASLRSTACNSPVVFMTVRGTERIAAEAFRLGVRDYLDKPFTVEEVQKAIDNALRERRLETERETLSRNLVTAEAVRLTVVTLNHYLNNYLTILLTGLKLLEEGLQQESSDPMLLKTTRESYQSVLGIKAVMQVLRDATNIELTTYTNSTPMVDIQVSLRTALEQLQMGDG